MRGKNNFPKVATVNERFPSAIGPRLLQVGAVLLLCVTSSAKILKCSLKIIITFFFCSLAAFFLAIAAGASHHSHKRLEDKRVIADAH